jgi:large subunit ribosomal protein L25
VTESLNDTTRTSIQRFPTMPTARATLAAERREITGKKVANLRRNGQLPGVVYGHGVDSTNVTIDGHEFEQLRRHSGPNALVDLSIDGQKAAPVLVHGIQVHPVNRRTLHVDLFVVTMTEELTVDVPLTATGESPAVTLQGGTLLHPIESVRIRALPDHLPQSIEYSVESLTDFDTTIHVRDLVVPSDVTLLTDGDEIIAKVQAPRVEEVVEVAPVEEGEGAAEGGETAEGAADGSADSGSSSDSGSSEA